MENYVTGSFVCTTLVIFFKAAPTSRTNFGVSLRCHLIRFMLSALCQHIILAHNDVNQYSFHRCVGVLVFKSANYTNKINSEIEPEGSKHAVKKRLNRGRLGWLSKDKIELEGKLTF